QPSQPRAGWVASDSPAPRRRSVGRTSPPLRLPRWRIHNAANSRSLSLTRARSLDDVSLRQNEPGRKLRRFWLRDELPERPAHEPLGGTVHLPPPPCVAPPDP